MNEAFRLSPRDVFTHRWLMLVGYAKLLLNEDAEALGWLFRSVQANRNYSISHFLLAAGLALLGSPDQASALVKAGLAVNPSYTIRRFLYGAHGDNPTHLARRERVLDGMRMAGVPEG